MLYLENGTRSYVVYRMAPVLEALNDLEGHSPVAGLSSAIRRTFVQYFTRFQLTARSRGFTATAGLLVILLWSTSAYHTWQNLLNIIGRIVCIAQMRPIATHAVAWSVCVCVCLYGGRYIRQDDVTFCRIHSITCLFKTSIERSSVNCSSLGLRDCC